MDGETEEKINQEASFEEELRAMGLDKYTVEKIRSSGFSSIADLALLVEDKEATKELDLNLAQRLNVLQLAKNIAKKRSSNVRNPLNFTTSGVSGVNTTLESGTMQGHVLEGLEHDDAGEPGRRTAHHAPPRRSSCETSIISPTSTPAMANEGHDTDRRPATRMADPQISLGARSHVLAKYDHRIQTSGREMVKLDVTRCSLQLEQKYFSASIDSERKEHFSQELCRIGTDQTHNKHSEPSDAVGSIQQQIYNSSGGHHSDRPTRERTVIVEGFQKGTPTDILRLLIEDSLGNDGIERFSLGPTGCYAECVISTVEMVEHIIATPPRQGYISMKVSRPPAFIHTSRTVEVIGLGPSITDQVIEVYFKNHTRSGGGPLEKVEVDWSCKVARVTFWNHTAAEEVVQRSPHKLGDCVLEARLIRPYSILDGQPHKREDSSTVEKSTPGNDDCTPIHSKDKEAFAELDTIEVKGFDPSLPEDYIKWFFENPGCLGGPIKNIEVENGAAVITFQDPRDAKKVVETNPRIKEDQELVINLIDTTGAGARTCAIEIEDIDSNFSEEKVTLFFENTSRSGGGNIEALEFDENQRKAVVTFESPEVVDRILAKGCLCLEGHTFKLSRVEPAPTPTVPTGPTAQQLLLVRHIPPKCTSHELKAFLCKHGNCEVKDVEYGLQPGTALVRFQSIPDYATLRESCLMKPLRGAMINIQKVERPKAIQVFNVGWTQPTTIQMYFENENRSGGGGETSILMRDTDRDCIVIGFENPSLMERVLQKQTHKLEGHVLQVMVYHEGLGILPPGHDTRTPAACLPSNVDVTITPVILRFWLNSVTVQQAIEAKLAPLHCTVLWPAQSSDPLRLVCELKQGLPNIQALAESWERDVRDAVLTIRDTFEHRQIQSPQQAWRRFLHKVHSLTAVDSGELDIHVDGSQFKILLIGKYDIVTRTYTELYAARQEIIKTIYREQQTVTETIGSLFAPQLKLLAAHGIPNRMQTKFPHLEYAIGDEEIVIRGTFENVTKAKQDTFEIVKNSCVEIIRLSIGLRNLLESNKVEQFLLEKLHGANAKVVWETVEDGVQLFSLSISDFEAARKAVMDSLRETRIPMPRNATHVLQGNQWENFENDVKSNDLAYIKVVSTEGENLVIVCAADSVFEQVMNDVRSFFEQHTVLDTFLQVPAELTRFVDIHMKPDIENICQSLGSRVKAEVVSQGNQHGIRLEGESNVINAAYQQMKHLIGQIHERHVTLTKPGIDKVLLGERGAQFCQTIEATMRVTVETSHRSTSNPQPETRVCFEGATLMVTNADLPSYQVDAIVNAANQELQHAGGLAGAIVKAGGLSIQTQCDQFVKNNGRLQTGSVYVSHPGKLPCKMVIHAVGPQWKDGNSGESDHLFKAVFESLKMAEHHQLRSIAIPAISTGIFGYPLEDAIRVILKAIKDYYLAGHSMPSEVHLVSNEAKSVDAFLQELQQMFGEGNVRIATATGKDTLHGQRAATTWNREADTPKRTASYKRSGRRRVTAVEGGVNVTLVSGSIERQKVDVIVNTTSKDFDLKSGAVSAAIARAGGPSLQDEITYSVPPGQIVVTSGGNLTCSRIYHGALEEWDGSNGQAPKVLRNFAKACLTQAAAESMTSLALPPLGTGNLSSPPDKVLKLMLEEIAMFSKNNVPTTLKDIYIVVYYKDDAKLSIFEKVLYSSTNEDEVMSRHAQYTSKDTSSSHVLETETEGVSAQTINIGPVELLIHQGDITRETTDAIVNSTNKQLNLSGAVGQAISKAAGPALVQECKTIGKIKDGIAVTSAGRLPMKYIIHLAPEDKGGSAPSAWQTLVKRALTEADKRGLTSIAFPALGTGTRSESVADIVDAMFEGVMVFVEKVKPKYLRQVVFTVFETQMLQVFLGTLKTKLKQEKKPTPWRRLLNILPQISIGRPKTATPRASSVATNFVKANIKLVLVIRGLSQSTIDKVIEEIEKFCDGETKGIVIDDPDQQAIIGKLSEQQVNHIESLAKPYDVEITVERKEGKNRIYIRGERDEAMQAWQDVSKNLLEIDQENKAAQFIAKQEKEAAQLLANQLRWEYQGDGSFFQYPPELSMKIEKAFDEHQQSYRWEEDGTTFQINFSEMMKEIIGQADSRTQVRREVIGDNQLPQDWERMASGERFKLVKLSTSGTEYNKVVNGFFQSIQNPSSRIVRVERVQNPRLLKLYQTHRAQMEESNPHFRFERMLWHGTAADALTNINAHGLNRNYSGKNATLLGHGVYFAKDASYSAQDIYSPADERGRKHMYYCNVLTGIYTKGKSELREPPEKDPRRPGDRYDSVVDRKSDPSIFVIFSDTQVYPEYLVTFK